MIAYRPPAGKGPGSPHRIGVATIVDTTNANETLAKVPGVVVNPPTCGNDEADPACRRIGVVVLLSQTDCPAGWATNRW